MNTSSLVRLTVYLVATAALLMVSVHPSSSRALPSCSLSGECSLAHSPSGKESGKEFPISPHADALVEWWYANAHVTTNCGRHLAVVCAFFKFGGMVTLPGMPPQPESHYLIYAVTDLDRRTQRAYSMGDPPMLSGLKELLLLTGATTPRTKSMLASLMKGSVPAPHREISGPVAISTTPFSLHYGDAGSMASMNSDNTEVALGLGGVGDDRCALTLRAVKPVMAVGGTGETGIVVPTDMYYYSLTRCAASGRIDAGDGWETITSGFGWVDHQWGSSWTTQAAGWDWWGVQLDNRVDILMFQQRNLATGTPFMPMATLMDAGGRLAVTKNVTFKPVGGANWRSPDSGVSYPLAWRAILPDQHLVLRITPSIRQQEIPILSPGGDIWEGACDVVATYRPFGIANRQGWTRTRGVAYMELVGYGSRGAAARVVPYHFRHRRRQNSYSRPYKGKGDMQ